MHTEIIYFLSHFLKKTLQQIQRVQHGVPRWEKRKHVVNKTLQSVILVPSYISGNIIETPLARRCSVDKVEHIGLTFWSYFKVCSAKQYHER